MLHYLSHKYYSESAFTWYYRLHLVSCRERSHSQERNFWMLFGSFKQVTTSICSAWERTVNVRVYRCENECLLTGSTTHCYYILEPDPCGIFETDTNIDFRGGEIHWLVTIMWWPIDTNMSVIGQYWLEFGRQRLVWKSYMKKIKKIKK